MVRPFYKVNRNDERVSVSMKFTHDFKRYFKGLLAFIVLSIAAQVFILSCKDNSSNVTTKENPDRIIRTTGVSSEYINVHITALQE